MTTLLPTSQSTGVEAYEDMFKEITRKLYGDESAHGLYPHNTQVAQLAPGAPTAPPDGGERSFTTLTQIGYETTTVGSSSAAGPEPAGGSGASAASTAFGLAALMQNGFPPPGAILNPVNFPPGTSKTPTNISTPSGDSNRWHSQQQQAAAEQESWSTGKHSSSTYGGKSSYKKPKTEPQDAAGLNIPSTADRTGKGGAQGGGPGSSASSSGTTPHAYKRYSCTTCPYTTDRRDLFTRHENIHKDEKPFQCYACLKPFNRADHVKKHFLRMHRELEYDIAKTRRCPPAASGTASSSTSSSSSSANTSKASGNYYGHMSSQSGNSGTVPTSTGASATTSTTQQQPMQLNIPSGSFIISGVHSLAHAHEGVSGQHHITTSGLNGGHSAGQLLQLQSLHHQQQQQQQQHNVHHSSITIKQEKGLASGGSSLNTSTSSAGGSLDDKSFVKKIKGEKKFACTFCPWAGTDNWGLKRHLNTHTKPYVCLLCDYKAARSERLATHVLKVHNKKACGKCSFFAEDQAHLDAHLQEAHPHDPTKVGKLTGTGGGGSNGSNGNATHHAAAAPNGNVLRNLGNAFTSNNLPTNIPTSGNGFGTGTSANGHYHTAAGHHAATGNVLTTSNAANLIDTINQHLASAVGQNGAAGSSLQQQHHQHQQQQHWMVKPHRKRNGPELLYSYLEADGSDSGDYARLLHMQAVGRNKASVTQDFHNAGGGDNGINGDHSSSDSGNLHPSNTAAIPLLVGSKADRMRNDPQDGSKGAAPTLAKASDNVALSLASLLGGDQLSFLQLLATAAVAHQQLQLHSSTGPYANAGGSSSSSSSGVQQKKQQQQPKPSKAATATVYQPSPVAGASKGDRYGSMVSSPPATANTLPHPQSQPRPATANSTSSSKHSANSTNGTTIVIPIGAPTTAGPGAATTTISGSPTTAYATGESGGGYKKRRLNGSSSSDKENLIHRKGHTGSAHHLPGATSDIIVNGGNAIVNGGGSKIGHNHHHNHHHHNNNNSSTSNKNINDIFDKVYKKPQNSFAPAKQHGVLPPILRIAPPAAAEDDVVNPVVIETEGHQFSLTEFLKNHTEVSISTVGNGTTAESKAGDDGEDSGVSIGEMESTEKLSASIQTVPPKKRKSEGERNPRKQQQPRRFDDSDSGGDALPLDLAPGEKPTVPSVTVNITPSEESMSEGKEAVLAKASSPELTETGSSDESCVSRLADIRDKHMTQLVSRRRCCRICQNRGLLDHLDNYHYHSKISLILHIRWRHARTHRQEVRCHQCGSQFRQAYKLALHRRLTHHTSSAAGKKTTVPKTSNGTAPGAGKRSNGKENLATNYSTSHHTVQVKSSSEPKKDGSANLGRKKQRRRKPRSRCFTPRRRK